MRGSLLALVLALTSPACGDDDSAPPADAASDGAAGDSARDSATGDAPPADANGADASPACAAQSASIGAEMYSPSGRGCTTVVRLDYQSRAPIAWQLVCGAYSGGTETQARTTAQADTGYGSSGTRLNPDPPDGEWVFYQAPADFGGAGVVAVDTGLSVFGGSIIWDGAGDITYPTSWRPAAELASGCSPSGGIPAGVGWDLTSGTPLPQPDVDAAVAVVLQTALPGAFWGGGYVFDSVVLLYPRSVGLFDPATAEWIVLVNGGWLE